MNKTKENKGVTLTVLIITVILLLIIAATATYIGVNNISNTQDQLALAELEQIKYVVGQCYLNYLKTNDTNWLFGEKLPTADVISFMNEYNVELLTIPNTYSEDERAYYLLTPEYLEMLGVENCQFIYVVNYVSGEVINVTIRATNEGADLYSHIRNNFNDVTGFSTNNTNQIETERNIFDSI